MSPLLAGQIVPFLFRLMLNFFFTDELEVKTGTAQVSSCSCPGSNLMNVFLHFSGHFLPVPESSKDFHSLLTLLESAYLFEESKHSFKYTTAFLLKNSTLEEKVSVFY